MADFDIQGARNEGYSDSEIAEYLSKQRRFNLEGARKEGYSDAEIVSHLTGTKVAQPAQEPSVLDKAKGVGEAALGVATGSIAAPVGAAVGIARNLVSGKFGTQEGVQEGQKRAEEISGALTYQPRTPLGKEYLGKVGEVIDQSKVAGLGPTESLNLMAASPVGAGRAPGRLEREAGELKTAAAKNAVKDATLTEARKEGYVLPPSQAKPNLLNNFIEGLAGKDKTAQKASIANQEVTNRLAKRALGIPDDQPITRDALQAVRKQAGAAYEAVKGAGPITADKEYLSALDAIEAPYKQASKDFAGADEGVSKMIAPLRKETFDSSSAVAKLRLLREDADKAFRTGDKSLGRATKAAADALEDQIGRHLENREVPAVRETGTVKQTTPRGTLGEFKHARQIIAQSYTIEKALNESTGNVSARVLANELKKNKPLKGDLRTAAKTAREFPRATQDVEKIGSPVSVSPLDAGIGATSALLSGNAAAFSAITGRPLLRSALLTGPYQSTLAPNYSPGIAGRAAALTQSAAPYAGATFPLSSMVREPE